jgi:hypothetical protein
MSELKQLERRIDESGVKGIKTVDVREDYEPAGDLMMRRLCDSGDYVQRKGYGYGLDQEWRIFKNVYKPY